MNRKQFKNKFKENLLWSGRSLNPFIDGHFLGAARLCMNVYFDKRRLTLNPRLVNQIAAHLYGGIKDFPRFDTLVGMAPAASIFASYLSMQLRNNNRGEIVSVFAEKKEDGIWICPSFEDAIKEMRAVIVEDVITSGKTVMSLKRRLVEMDCTVVGVVSIASRMIWTPTDTHYFNLVQIDDTPVPRSVCSKCLEGIEHNKMLGHG